MESRTIPIDPELFCDGHYYVLLSQSLGGSGLDADALSGILGDGEPDRMNDLLDRGVCLPVFFGGDCALDGGTVFVLGELDERHEKGWVARLTGKLAVPCGKLVLMCGGGDPEYLARAISGREPDPDYVIYQTVDVPPGTYRVDLYAYPSSMSVYFVDGNDDLEEDDIAKKYAHLPAVDVGYVIQLRPLQGDVPRPALVEDVGWPGEFQVR